MFAWRKAREMLLFQEEGEGQEGYGVVGQAHQWNIVSPRFRIKSKLTGPQQPASARKGRQRAEALGASGTHSQKWFPHGYIE